MLRGFLSFLLMLVILCYATTGAAADVVASGSKEEDAVANENSKRQLDARRLAENLDLHGGFVFTAGGDDVKRSLLAKKAVAKRACKKNPKRCQKSPPPAVLAPKKAAGRRLLGKAAGKAAAKGKAGGKGKAAGKGKKGM